MENENIEENILDLGIIPLENKRKNHILDIILVINFAIIIILMLLILTIYVSVNYMGKYYNDLEITNKFDKLKGENIYSLGLVNLDVDDSELKQNVIDLVNKIEIDNSVIYKISDYSKFKKIDIVYKKYDMNERVTSLSADITVTYRNKKENYICSVSRLKKNNKMIKLTNVIKSEYIDDFKKLCESKKNNLDYDNFILFNDSIRIFDKASLDHIDIKYNDIDEYLQNGIFTKSNVARYDEVFSGTINPYEPMIALTFDDGPTVNNTRRILNTLTKYNSKATFFVVGYMVDQNPEILNEILNQGSEVANHTRNHLNLNLQNEQTIRDEIGYVESKIFDITGKKCTALRPPYGNRNDLVKSVVTTPMILWNIDTLDWKTRNAEMVKNHILENIEDGDIVLMHDLYESTAEAVEMVVPILKERGYQLVTVDELIKYKEKDVKAGDIIMYLK